MKLSLAIDELSVYLERMLERAFPDGRRLELKRPLDEALERTERCFSSISLRGYGERDSAVFDHLHGDQFAMFLYLLSSAAWRGGNEELAKKACLLNRMRHGLLIMYDTDLPDIFLIPHTVGTVIGKAHYENYTVFCQGVTIGNDPGTQLTIGRGVVFFPGAFVVGTGTIGAFSAISSNSTVLYQDVAPNTVVSGRSPDLNVWERKRDFLARYFFAPYTQ